MPDTLLFSRVYPLIFKYHPEIKHNTNALNGSIIFDVKKSKVSKIVFPNIFIFSKLPKDNVAGIAIIEIMKNNKTQALTLDIFKFSTKVAQGHSTILIAEVTAALNNKTKNAKEIQFPKAIWENIFGKVTKASPAPEFGSILNENTAGKIIIPAKSANAVSDKIIV